MSLVSWFREASFKKKAAVTAFAAVNALTFVSSAKVGFIVTDTLLENGDPVARQTKMHPGVTAAVITVAAPLMMFSQWGLSRFDGESKAGRTPVSFLGNQTKKILSEDIDLGIGVAFLAAGAPGAWVGHAAGAMASTTVHALRP